MNFYCNRHGEDVRLLKYICFSTFVLLRFGHHLHNAELIMYEYGYFKILNHFLELTKYSLRMGISAACPLYWI
jgi:hypothetical protein